ncbi:12039_t:CDS:2 [Dentiscutata heterogama]|uniref:12039_t:CDS:1 n=1 Tax=Dentiscutata heterogama TaxID=1316150 RepID=A0ACA9KIE1_9GLOM|nr:12039_t:CDS:2 [Dentiscutata heterogama]
MHKKENYEGALKCSKQNFEFEAVDEDNHSESQCQYAISLLILTKR